jgi:hypothetical protein
MRDRSVRGVTVRDAVSSAMPLAADARPTIVVDIPEIQIHVRPMR